MLHPRLQDKFVQVAPSSVHTIAANIYKGMCDTPNPERGVPVNIPITLFGYTETHRFRKFEPPYLEWELARLADARVYYGHRSNLGANLNDVQPKGTHLLSCNWHPINISESQRYRPMPVSVWIKGRVLSRILCLSSLAPIQIRGVRIDML